MVVTCNPPRVTHPTLVQTHNRDTLIELVREYSLSSTKYECSRTLANSTLIILFSKMFEIFQNYFFQIEKYCEG
jgi:hypothetical protein